LKKLYLIVAVLAMLLVAIVPGLGLGYGLDVRPAAAANSSNQNSSNNIAAPDLGNDPRLTLNQGVEQEVGPSGDISQPFTVTNSGDFADQYVDPTLNANTGSVLNAVDTAGVLQYTD
jgi:hypothetical protein